MANYVIAGKSSDPLFAQAEILGYHLQKNLPDYHIQVHMKKESEWKQYVSETFKANGWNHRLATDRSLKNESTLDQLVYRSSGELVGNTLDFVKWMKHSYDIELNFEAELLQEIALENESKFHLDPTTSNPS